MQNPFRAASSSSLLCNTLLSILLSTVLAACGGSGTADSPEPSTPEASVGTTVSTTISTAQDSSQMQAAARPLGTPAASAVAATVLLGDPTINPLVDNLPGGVSEAFGYTAAASGSANSLILYIDAGNTATRVVAGVYADASGSPGSLLASGVIDNPRAAAWNSVALSPLQITAGQGYWIAVLTPRNSGNIKFRYVAGGARPSFTSAQDTLSTLPAAWINGTRYDNAGISAYVSASEVTPPVGGVSAGYTLCARENQVCSFTGMANVIYGANSTWSNPRSFTNGVSCNNTTFGDPLPGTVKSCYYQSTTASTPQRLTVSTSPGGSVTSSPSGILCGSSCSANFAPGTAVLLSATPIAGYTFSGWSSACSGAGSCSVTMNSAQSVSANFAPVVLSTKTLSLTVSGMGSVSFSDGSVCNATCTKTFNAGTGVTLAAQAASGYTFAGWSGVCSGTGGCSVTMDAAKSVLANFNAVVVVPPIGPGPTPIPAGAYYVSPSGSDTGTGNSASPWKTFSKAFASMRSGEFLVVKNGTYTESIGVTQQPPSGSASKLTVVRAETDGGVVIDAKGLDSALVISGDYVRIEGMKFVNGETSVGILSGNHIEVLRSAFGNSGTGLYTNILNASGNNILVEDSWMWGRGRVGVEVNGAQSTLRRLVIRLDHYSGTLGYVGVVTYGASNTVIENVITLDFNTAATTFDWKGGFRSRDMYEPRTQRYHGTIVLNIPYDGYRMSDSFYENVIAWGVAGRGGLYEDSYYTGYTVKNATVGASTSDGIKTNVTPVTNSLVYKVSGTSTAGSYNQFYQAAVPSGSTNVLTTDPQLRYITRVEPGSSASSSGAGGVNRGATVTHRYQNGVLTTQPLWPWPNEARIKTDFQTDFGLPGVGPRRGFAATGNGLRGTPVTLTSYVWEFLGYPCPSDICF